MNIRDVKIGQTLSYLTWGPPGKPGTGPPRKDVVEYGEVRDITFRDGIPWKIDLRVSDPFRPPGSTRTRIIFVLAEDLKDYRIVEKSGPEVTK